MILSRLNAARRNDSGSVAVSTALLLATTLSFGAVSLDAGMAYTHKRRQQTATDLAALAAASQLGSATAASSSVSANGYDPSSIASIEPGIYVSDASLAPSARFTPTTSGTPNAVRVTMRQTHRYLFGSLIGYVGSTNAIGDPAVTTRSVAAARHVASFSLGSGLVSLNNGIANSVLSSLIGSNVSLSAVDYQSLANVNINLFTFSNALASRIGVTAGTYDQVANTWVSVPAAIAAAGVAGASTQASAALGAILAAVGTQASVLKIGTLIDYGPYGGFTVGSAGPMTASITALDLVSAILQASNGHSQVETAVNASLPGIASASVKLSVGEPAVGSSLVALGAQGTQLTTAQLRLRLSLQLVGPSQAPTLNLPITVDVASGTAKLQAISCNGGLSTSTVKIGVTPGLVNAWIGAVSDADLANTAVALNPPPATIANVAGVLQATGRAHVVAANQNQTVVPFNYAEVGSGTEKTVSTTDLLAPLVGNLVGGTQVNTTILGASLFTPTLINNAIGQTLANEAAPIDTILASALAVLGVQVGNATVWVSGVQCGQSVLVN